jgi:hypothetical protein
MSTAADRIATEDCGCRYDVPTGMNTYQCDQHDPRLLLAEARRIAGAWADRNEDAYAVMALIDRATEALDR